MDPSFPLSRCLFKKIYQSACSHLRALNIKSPSLIDQHQKICSAENKHPNACALHPNNDASTFTPPPLYLTNAFEMKNLPAIFISRESSGRHSRSQRHQQIFSDNFPCSKFGILASFLKKKKEKENQLKTLNKP